MVDQELPNAQFHRYQAPEAVPHSEESQSNVTAALTKMGLSEETAQKLGSGIGNLNLQGSLNKARDYARSNPGRFLGGMAAAVIGAGLLARGMKRR
ncbi:MAG: hypothetical protein ABI718_06515 [Acidobacteriota bacterium]